MSKSLNLRTILRQACKEKINDLNMECRQNFRSENNQQIQESLSTIEQIHKPPHLLLRTLAQKEVKEFKEQPKLLKDKLKDNHNS